MHPVVLTILSLVAGIACGALCTLQVVEVLDRRRRADIEQSSRRAVILASISAGYFEIETEGRRHRYRVIREDGCHG